MSTDVERIKDRLSIDEVVGQYIKLEKAGKNLKALCPFHNEKSPSFIVSPDRGTFYCFGCGAKGDIFSFVEQYESLDFASALKLLAERAGVPLSNDNPEQRSRKKEAYDLLDQVTAYYEAQLPHNEQATAYLAQRGVTDAIRERWRIGVAPQAWDNVLQHFTKKGATETSLERIGLIKKGERGDYYDRFRNRIMFPIADATGRIVGFTGRLIVDDDKQAKYVNSPETEFFSKSHILYGYHLAKSSIRKHNFSILVEGQFDVIMAHAMGYTNTVATSGTAITEDQLAMLARLSSRLVIALDADGAGFRASERAWHMALHRGMDVKIAELPAGKDPADLALENPDVWKQAIKGAKHIIDFVTDRIAATGISGRDLARALHEQVIPYIARLESSIEQAHFVDRLAGRFGINKDALWQEVSGQDAAPDTVMQAAQPEDVQKEKEQYSIEQQLFGIVHWQQASDTPAIDVTQTQQRVTTLIGDDAWQEIQRTVDTDELIFITEALYADETVLESVVHELLQRLERSLLETKRKELKQKLHHASATGDSAQEDTILKELTDVAKRIEALQ